MAREGATKNESRGKGGRFRGHGAETWRRYFFRCRGASLEESSLPKLLEHISEWSPDFYEALLRAAERVMSKETLSGRTLYDAPLLVARQTFTSAANGCGHATLRNTELQVMLGHLLASATYVFFGAKLGEDLLSFLTFTADILGMPARGRRAHGVQSLDKGIFEKAATLAISSKAHSMGMHLDFNERLFRVLPESTETSAALRNYLEGGKYKLPMAVHNQTTYLSRDGTIYFKIHAPQHLLQSLLFRLLGAEKVNALSGTSALDRIRVDLMGLLATLCETEPLSLIHI